MQRIFSDNESTIRMHLASVFETTLSTMFVRVCRFDRINFVSLCDLELKLCLFERRSSTLFRVATLLIFGQAILYVKFCALRVMIFCFGL